MSDCKIVPKCVLLKLLNTSFTRGFFLDYLRFWINTIVTYCKGSVPGFPKIMIVLTHKDKLEAVSMNLFDIF